MLDLDRFRAEGSGEEQKAAMPPGAEVLPDQDARKNTLRELQVRLGRLLRRYYLGEYKVDALHGVVAELEEERAKPPTTEDFELSRPSLLYATARALQEQIYNRRGDDRAREEFSKAVAVFDEVLSKEGELSAQCYAEYGVALRMIGERQQDARKYLERAITLGFSTPETHRHLARIIHEPSR